MIRHHLGAPLALVSMAGLIGCARTARPPSLPRPIDEGHAIAVITQAYREGGQHASEGREIRLASGRMLKVDVGTAGHDFGVAYLTSAELAALDPPRDLPPRLQSDDLPVVQGSGPDADAIILVLLAENYIFGEPDGGAAGPKSAPSEQKLARDVRDFLVQARAHHLP